MIWASSTRSMRGAGAAVRVTDVALAVVDGFGEVEDRCRDAARPFGGRGCGAGSRAGTIRRDGVDVLGLVVEFDVGDVDDHLEVLAGEEPAEAALADAVGGDDLRAGAGLGADAVEQVLEDGTRQTVAGWPRFTTPMVSSSSCEPSSV